MSKDYIIYGKENKRDFREAPTQTLGKFLWEILIKHEGTSLAEVVELTEEKSTIGEIIEQSKSISHSLSNLGCGLEDLTVVICGNELAFSPCLLGCLWNGNPFAPLYDGYTIDDYIHYFNIYKPKIIIVTKEAYPRVSEAYKLTSLKTAQMVIIGRKEENDNFENCLYLVDLWSIEVNNFKPIELPESELGDHCCLIMPSSGTTGLPKGVRHTDKSFLTAFYFSINKMKFGQYFITLTGGYWMSGVFCRLRALALNYTNILLDFDCESYLKCIDKYKIAFLFLTPGYFGQFMKYNWGSYDLSSVKLISFGGGIIPEEILNLAERKLKNVIFVNGYGMTEIPSVFAVSNRDFPRGTIGKLLPRTMGKVIDSETGQSLPPNQNGELCIKTATMMQGYHNNPKATAEAIDEEGWLHTGDMAYYTKEEYFYIVDRIKQLIKYKSHHINANQIENIIHKLPGISEVCVVGIPHDFDWEHARAFVVRSPDSQLTSEMIINHCKEHLQEINWLHGGVQFTDSLPKTPSGKYMRQTVRKMYQADK